MTNSIRSFGRLWYLIKLSVNESNTFRSHWRRAVICSIDRFFMILSTSSIFRKQPERILLGVFTGWEFSSSEFTRWELTRGGIHRREICQEKFSIHRLSQFSFLLYESDMHTLIKPHEATVYTGRKLNVYKTFRRRSGRLLNILCTFNLRPVSTGNELKQSPNCTIFEVQYCRKLKYKSLLSILCSKQMFPSSSLFWVKYASCLITTETTSFWHIGKQENGRWKMNRDRKIEGFGQKYNHCVKSVQIRSYFWSAFSSEKYGPEITPYLNTIHAVNVFKLWLFCVKYFLKNFKYVQKYISAINDILMKFVIRNPNRLTRN